MIISVFKEHSLVNTLDLSKDVDGINGPLTFFVGRDEKCHACLSDKQVSREHGSLTYENGTWTIKKLSDFKPILINGASINESVLNNADVISIGPFTLNIELPVKQNQAPQMSEIENEMVTSDEETEEETTAFEVEEKEEVGTTTVMLDSIDDDLEEAVPEEPMNTFESENEVEAEDSLEESLENEEFAEDGFAQEAEFDNDGFDDDFNVDGEDDYGMESVDDDSTRVIQSFAQITLMIDGEYAPYDKFVIEKPSTTIGRDPEKCDIVLNDPEVSSVHAVIKKNNIMCFIEDQKSGNGTILNGERINSHDITNGDEIIIGSTVFTVAISSDFIKNEADRLMPVEENQIVEVEEIVEVDTNFDDGTGVIEGGIEFGDAANVSKSKSLFSKEALKDPEKRKKLLIYAVVLLAVWTLLPEEKKPPPKQAKKEAKSNLLEPEKKDKQVKGKNKAPLTPEQIEFVDSTYILAKELNDRGKYSDAILELEKIFQLTDDYKNSRQIYELAKQAVKELERIQQKEKEELERKQRALKVKELVAKASDAVKERRVEFAESLFGEIAKLDPENFELTNLKNELEYYKKEEERKALEIAEAKAEDERQKKLLSPGKTFYTKEEWFKAVVKLEEFLTNKGMKDEYIKEASDMLKDSREKLSSLITPMVSKARSLKEGQDLKGAYEVYKEIVKIDPNHAEALNEMNLISETLSDRSKKVYREAIISESLSLFDDAKEKFQEVQQISPTDSDYYQKATEKLKNYLE